jgi:hypothetical protein
MAWVWGGRQHVKGVNLHRATGGMVITLRDSNENDERPTNEALVAPEEKQFSTYQNARPTPAGLEIKRPCKTPRHPRLRPAVNFG